MIRIPRVILTVCAAALMSLAFHPIGLYFCAWVGLIPLLYAIDRQPMATTYRLGILFGALFSLFSLFWLVYLQIDVGTKLVMFGGLVLMFLYFGFYFGTGLLISRLVGIWSLPFILTGFEFVRGIGEIGFPWLFLGYSQARYPLITQQASLFGVYGVTFWIVLSNVLLFQALKLRTAKIFFLLALVYIVPICYGAIRLSTDLPPAVAIGIVQPNIDPNLKFTRAMREETFHRLIYLSERCAQTAAARGDTLSLIIWPETATPVFLRYPGEHQERVYDLATRLDIPIFTGTPLLEHRNIYNGAVLIIPRIGVVQEYRKLHLVPFGEHIPFDQYIPLFKKIDVGGGDYTPGSVYTVFDDARIPFSCLICFESIFPELSRMFVVHGARLLVNITNDGWFGRISGSQQHNDMAILRAVENNVPLCRSANTGISMIVDHHGRVVQETELFTEAHLYGKLAIPPSSTFYCTVGALLPILSLIIVSIAVCLVLIRNRRTRLTNTHQTV